MATPYTIPIKTIDDLDNDLGLCEAYRKVMFQEKITRNKKTMFYEMPHKQYMSLKEIIVYTREAMLKYVTIIKALKITLKSGIETDKIRNKNALFMYQNIMYGIYFKLLDKYINSFITEHIAFDEKNTSFILRDFSMWKVLITVWKAYLINSDSMSVKNLSKLAKYSCLFNSFMKYLKNPNNNYPKPY